MKHFIYAILWALLAGILCVWGDQLAAHGLLDHPGIYCILAIGLPGIMVLRKLMQWRNNGALASK